MNETTTGLRKAIERKSLAEPADVIECMNKYPDSELRIGRGLWSPVKATTRDSVLKAINNANYCGFDIDVFEGEIEITCVTYNDMMC